MNLHPLYSKILTFNTINMSSKAKKTVQQPKQDITNVETCDFQTMTSEDVLKLVTTTDQYDNVFGKLNDLFLDYSNNMSALDEKRQHIIELMKVIHTKFKDTGHGTKYALDKTDNKSDNEDSEGDDKSDESSEMIVTKPKNSKKEAAEVEAEGDDEEEEEVPTVKPAKKAPAKKAPVKKAPAKKEPKPVAVEEVEEKEEDEEKESDNEKEQKDEAEEPEEPDEPEEPAKPAKKPAKKAANPKKAPAGPGKAPPKTNAKAKAKAKKN